MHRRGEWGLLDLCILLLVCSSLSLRSISLSLSLSLGSRRLLLDSCSRRAWCQRRRLLACERPAGVQASIARAQLATLAGTALPRGRMGRDANSSTVRLRLYGGCGTHFAACLGAGSWRGLAAAVLESREGACSRPRGAKRGGDWRTGLALGPAG
jgi:hypothetical protein